jgi:hypothetical protein
MAIAILLALFACAVIIVIVYRRDTARQSPFLQRILLSLRLFLLALVGSMLLEPRLRVESQTERASRVALAVDDSLSMSLPATDPIPNTESKPIVNRLSAARDQLLLDQFASTVTATHELHLYHAARSSPVQQVIPRRTADPSPVESLQSSLAQWAPSQTETRLGESIVGIIRDQLDAPLAGIVLLTDGRQNDGASLDAAIKIARQAGIPIYPVGIGSAQPPFNIRVSEIRAPTRVFKGDRVHGTATIEATAQREGTVAVEIILRSVDTGRPATAANLLEVQDVTLPKDGVAAPLEFSFVPEETGRFEIVCQATPQPGEVRDDDNRSLATIDVVDQKTKVLLWAGGPTREYRFIRNLLFRDSSIDLSVYLQTARATSAQEAKENLVQFPSSREELFRFDVIIAVDPNWSAIGNEAIALVEEWVSRQAGGAILIAGPIYTPNLARDIAASPGSPIESLYPVLLKEVFASDFEAGRFRDPWKLQFTPEGNRASYLQLDDDDSNSRRRWDEFPGFYWCYPATSIKPAATLLASYSDPRASVGAAAPALMATQFVGAGRVFYLGSGEFWRLRASGESAYNRFWIRLVREMSQSRLMRGSGRAMILVDGDRFDAGSTLPVRCQILGPDYRPISQGVVPLSLTGPDQKTTSIDMVPSASRPGFFEASITLGMPGEYRLQTLVPDSTQVLQRSITAEIPAKEFAEPTLNEAGLQQLATQTSGKYSPISQLKQIPPLLIDRTEQAVLPGAPIPLWDNTWMLLASILLAGTEWLLRKLANLA